MEIKEAQDKIKSFDEARGWEDGWNLKDLLLNITEEGGEVWNLVKWIDDEKQREVVKKNQAEVADYVGDTLFLLLKIANQTGVDASEALNKTLQEYEGRMPPEVMKKLKHANKSAGGYDNKMVEVSEIEFKAIFWIEHMHYNNPNSLANQINLNNEEAKNLLLSLEEKGLIQIEYREDKIYGSRLTKDGKDIFNDERWSKLKMELGY
jgi:NTP pyrophosphatase (non-canonical NTP hydrolase)/predicted transcriptional regulator